MGKIYRVSHSKSRDFLGPEYRSTFALQFWVVLLVCVSITISGFSQTGTIALGLLVTPILGLLVISTFQTSFPRSTTTILISVAVLGLLTSIGTLIYGIVWFHWLIEPPPCLPEDCRWDNKDWDYALQLRGSLSDNIIEFTPLALTSIVYLSALLAQLKVVTHHDAA